MSIPSIKKHTKGQRFNPSASKSQATSASIPKSGNPKTAIITQSANTKAVSFPTIEEQLIGQRFVPLGQALEILLISRATLWRKCKSGEYPPLVNLTGKIRAFCAADFIDLINRIESGSAA